MVRNVMAEYIEREALEKAMTIAAANGKDKDRRTWAKAICVLHDMPAADVAPVVHGKDLAQPSLFKCSVCGCEDDDTYTCDVSEYRYCPNCGAKMDEHVEENKE